MYFNIRPYLNSFYYYLTINTNSHTPITGDCKIEAYSELGY